MSRVDTQQRPAGGLQLQSAERRASGSVLPPYMHIPAFTIVVSWLTALMSVGTRRAHAHLNSLSSRLLPPPMLVVVYAHMLHAETTLKAGQNTKSDLDLQQA